MRKLLFAGSVRGLLAIEPARRIVSHLHHKRVEPVLLEALLVAQTLELGSPDPDRGPEYALRASQVRARVEFFRTRWFPSLEGAQSILDEATNFYRDLRDRERRAAHIERERKEEEWERNPSLENLQNFAPVSHPFRFLRALDPSFDWCANPSPALRTLLESSLPPEASALLELRVAEGVPPAQLRLLRKEWKEREREWKSGKRP